MKKEEVMAALFSVMAGTDKAISELSDPEKRKTFESEIEALAEDVMAKAQALADLKTKNAQLKAALQAEKDSGAAALEKLAGENTAGSETITKLQEELKKFGETEAERAKFLEDHATLNSYYEENKGEKYVKGDDAEGAQIDSGAGDGGKSGKEAKVGMLVEMFPSLGNMIKK